MNNDNQTEETTNAEEAAEEPTEEATAAEEKSSEPAGEQDDAANAAESEATVAKAADPEPAEAAEQSAAPDTSADSGQAEAADTSAPAEEPADSGQAETVADLSSPADEPEGEGKDEEKQAADQGGEEAASEPDVDVQGEPSEAQPTEAADPEPSEKTMPAAAKTDAAAEESPDESEQPTESADPEAAQEAAPAAAKTDAAAEESPDESEQPTESADPEAAQEAAPVAAKTDAAAAGESDGQSEQPAESADSEPSQEAAPAAASADASEEADDDDDDGENQEESFEALLEQYDKFRQYRPGDLVEGTVVSLGETEVLLDIGARVEGTVPASELKDSEGALTVKDGDKIKVMVCRFNPDSQYVPLSYERARVSRVWDDIEEVSNTEKRLEGTVIEKVKGGFIVDVGVRAFLPTSQASLRPQKDMQDILGKKLDFSILKIQRRRGNLILSRRDILQQELETKKTDLFEKLQEGSVLTGRVKNITDYGVFIDLGGLDGLLHITDMSWGRVTHPKDLVELDQEIEVKVLRFDREKEKVSLGLKQCTPDPWLSASEKYPPNAKAKGKVLNLTSYGAFVELEPGVEGMVHVSELSWTKKIRNPAQFLNKGQEVDVRVLDIDTENRRVSLSLKQTEDNPWDSLAERFPVGSKVTGKVRNITEFGAFVEIEDGIDGLVHVSDFSWGERAVDPNDYVKKGEEVEVVILAVDNDNHKVSLGMKQLSADPWIEFTKKFKPDQIITAPVSRVTDFGVFLKLSENVEALIRQNELAIDRKDKIADHFQEGQEVQALITRISHRDRKVDLSMRRLEHFHERQALREYTQNNDSGGAKIGDLIGHELKKLVK